MRVLIAGCGYVGTALGERLVGAEVWGLRRDSEALRELAPKGIKPISADLLNLGSVKFPDVDFIIFCQAVSRDSDDYLRTYVQATRNLLEVYQAKPVKKIIFISSTSVYSTQDGSWVDEGTVPGVMTYESEEAEKNARALLEGERTVLSSGIPAVVFRLAGIYGPGRNRVRALKEGKMKPSFSEMHTNRIHREDIVSGIILLMEKGRAGEIYVGADDEPSTQKEFYSWMYEKLNLTKPDSPAAAQGRPVHVSNRRCSNEKLKKLGLKLKYPTFREGYADLL